MGRRLHGAVKTPRRNRKLRSVLGWAGGAAEKDRKLQYSGTSMFLVGCAVCGLALVVLVAVWRRRKSRSCPSDQKDVVLLRSISKSPDSFQLSPFRIKLETYLRLAKIPYKVVYSSGFSPKGKTPWIEYNGTMVSDSHFCIEFLNSEHGVDLNTHLSPINKAIARAFQKMIEENLFWCMVLSRWVYEEDKTALKSVGISYPSLKFWLISRHQKKLAWNHGLGRHSWNEIKSIMKNDLEAISEFLGSKKFLMGDEVSEVDCITFGMLAQFYWYLPNSYGKQLLQDCYSNLEQYCERMRLTYWPNLPISDSASQKIK